MKFADLMFVVLLDAMCTDNEGGIALCVNTVVYCVVCSMPIKCMRNVYGMREFTGKYIIRKFGKDSALRALASAYAERYRL